MSKTDESVQSVDCKIFRGHTRRVSSVSFSPDGSLIVSGSSDYTVRVWDASSGECVVLGSLWGGSGPLEGHTSGVNSVSFSPDGSLIVSGAGDNTVRVWDLSSGGLLKTLEGHRSDVRSVSFSPDGSHIVSGSDDRTVRVWDLSSGECVLLEGHTFWVSSVSFSPDGSLIVSGSYDKTVRVWDLSSGELLKTLGHTSLVSSVSFSPDGSRIVSGSGDATVRVWDLSSGECVLGPLEGHTSDVNSVSFSPDGSRIVSGSNDNTVRVWDVSIIKEWDSLVRDIKSLKIAWDRNEMPYGLMLQKSLWYGEILKKMKLRADSVGFKIDVDLYKELKKWCTETIREMAGIYNEAKRQKISLRLRF